MIPKLCIVIGGFVVAITIGDVACAVDETPAVVDKSTFTAEQIEFFEAEIRPVLVQRCYDCHSTDAAELQAGLYVDSREAMIKGGESGAAVVVGKPDVRFGEVGLAFVELNQGSELSPDELSRWCHGELANYKVPKEFVLVTGWPLLPNGKIDRKALKERAIQ